MKQTQLVYIHGGMTFKTKKAYLHFLRHRDVALGPKIRWSGAYLDRKLGKGFEITRPRMPLQDDARYKEWAIHFERYIPKLKHGVILIGESLGGIFLAKYLSENRFPKRIRATYLICPPFDNTLTHEDLVGGFRLKADLSLLEKNCPKLRLMFSKNDQVIPISHAEKYRAKLKEAEIIIYDHVRGHFEITEFPEIVEMIRQDVR